MKRERQTARYCFLTGTALFLLAFLSGVPSASALRPLTIESPGVQTGLEEALRAASPEGQTGLKEQLDLGTLQPKGTLPDGREIWVPPPESPLAGLIEVIVEKGGVTTRVLRPRMMPPTFSTGMEEEVEQYRRLQISA